MVLEKEHVVVDVFGKLACFTNPMFRGERVTYDVITPSAARGILCSIYFKRREFYYEITKIEVMNEIRHIDIRKNEIKNGRIKVNDPTKSIFRDKIISKDGKESNNFTRRTNRYLKDVYYRIHANIVKQPDCPWKKSIKDIKDEFTRRVNGGKCFKQPVLGTNECIAFFEPPDYNKKPISVSKNFGIILYDVFDVRKNEKLTIENKNEVINIQFFNAKMENGIIDIPPYEEIAKDGIYYD